MIDFNRDTKVLSKYLRKIKAMQNVKIDVEITHNILRKINTINFDDTIEKAFTDKKIDTVDTSYASPRNKNYFDSLQGMRLILESLLNQKIRSG